MTIHSSKYQCQMALCGQLLGGTHSWMLGWGTEEFPVNCPECMDRLLTKNVSVPYRKDLMKKIVQDLLTRTQHYE